jgi:hypothetical protein
VFDLIDGLRPQLPLNATLLINMSQPQLPLAEATPDDMTMAATIAAQSSATRIFLIDMRVRLLFGSRVPRLVGRLRVGSVVLRECHDQASNRSPYCYMLGHLHKTGGSRRLCW